MGLSGRQYMVLAILDSDAPPSQLELAGLCGLLPAQVVPVLDLLEERGLVQRQRADEDRRRMVVRLTDAGRDLLDRADELERSISNALFGDLDDETRERFVDTLRVALSRSYNTRG
jgi:DNA-binding MarR family transcriptional regulator